MFKDLFNKLIHSTKKVVTLPTARTSSGEFLLKETDFGRIRVDFMTVQKIAERALTQVEGIREPSVAVEKISNAATPMRIRLTIALAEGYSAPRVSEAADKAINSELRELLQPEFYVPVDVKVKQITQATAPTRRRVR